MSIQHNLWTTWASLAIRHERCAWNVRRGHASADQPDLSGELRESLLAMAASAFALDGFYGAIRDQVRQPTLRTRMNPGFGARLKLAWRVLRRPRPTSPAGSSRRASTIFETVKRASGVSGKTISETWLPEFKWLFGARTQGVHHLPQFSEGSPHPSVQGLAADEYALYRAENATRAVDLVLAVLEGCLSHPKRALREWAGKNAGLLSNLLSERQSEHIG